MGGKPRATAARTPTRLAKREVIAERTYELVTEAGKKRDVVLRIGRPRPDRGSVSCPLEIAGLETPSRPMMIGGVDGIQALTQALGIGHMTLRLSDSYEGGRLLWIGQPDLGLPGLQQIDTVRLDWFFQDEGGYRALLATLLGSPALFAWRFRSAIGRLLELPLGNRPLEVVSECSVGQGLEPPEPSRTIDLVAYPDPEIILAIELVLSAAAAGGEELAHHYRLLRAEEDLAAAREGRGPRRIHMVLVVPNGSPRPVEIDARPPDVVSAMDWKRLFSVFDSCQHLVGNLGEPILGALCTAAAAGYDSIQSRPPSPKAIRLPERERVWHAMRRARIEFQRSIASDPMLSGTVWAAEGSRTDQLDEIGGSFIEDEPYPRFRRLSIVARQRTDTTFDLRIAVKAGGSSREQPGWDARRRALHACGKQLSWRSDARRDERSEIHHELAVDVTSSGPMVGGVPLTDLLVEGLTAYARAFGDFLREPDSHTSH